MAERWQYCFKFKVQQVGTLWILKNLHTTINGRTPLSEISQARAGARAYLVPELKPARARMTRVQ